MTRTRNDDADSVHSSIRVTQRDEWYTHRNNNNNNNNSRAGLQNNPPYTLKLASLKGKVYWRRGGNLNAGNSRTSPSILLLLVVVKGSFMGRTTGTPRWLLIYPILEFGCECTVLRAISTFFFATPRATTG